MRETRSIRILSLLSVGAVMLAPITLPDRAEAVPATTTIAVAGHVDTGTRAAARPRASVRLTSDATLKVDVNPNLSGNRAWRVRVERWKKAPTKKGKWKKVCNCRTVGAAETLVLDLPKGKYRVRVLPRKGYKTLRARKTIKFVPARVVKVGPAESGSANSVSVGRVAVPPSASGPSDVTMPLGSGPSPSVNWNSSRAMWWPMGQDTGVPAGVTLKASGPITVTTPGTVIDGLLVSGGITVKAKNVVIRNTKVVGGNIDVGDDAGNPMYTVIEDVELDGTGWSGNTSRPGIGYTGFTARRVNIHGYKDGVNAMSDVDVRDSWLHDMAISGNAVSGSHNQAVLSNGGSRLTFIHNRLDAGPQGNFTAALTLLGDFAQIADVLVQDNLVNGGGYALYAGSTASKPYPVAKNARFINNTFGKAVFPKSGYYGPATDYKAATGSQWTGNVWQDTGTPVNP